MTLAGELKKVLRGEVEDAPQILEAYSRDASLFAVTPEVVVHPKDATDIGILVRYATKIKEKPGGHMSLTARSAGTDMSGGPLNDSVIVDMTKHFSRLLELGSDYAVVEPGMYFRDFDKETKKKNLELPSYTASREINTVGGMVANNSGGEKNLKYGKTARYVQELDVVLADGQTYTLKNLEGEALQQKLNKKDFEGDIYRAVSKLISTHRAVIEAGKPKVEKNSSGYALWDMGDPSGAEAGGIPSLNLARLMVGSQGTLGLITKIKFSLVHPQPYSAMTILFLDSLSELGKIVPQVLEKKPDSFESYDDNTFKLAVKYFPEFAGQMKAGIISLGISFLPELWMLLTGGIPKLVLMVEFRADTQEEALKKAVELEEEIKKTQPNIGSRVAKNEHASKKYWAIRRESFNLLRKKIRNKRTAPFIDDFVVPPRTLSEFLPKLEAILKPYEKSMQYTVAGHVGDGNFHIIPLVDPANPDTAKIIDELSHKVYDLVISYHGSISGEHNDGFIRTPYVEKMFGPEMFALFLQIKKIFDPHNIFNPGKKVGTTFSDAFAHLDLPKGK
ncbi:MAG: FAD-binding oxidoreductase [Candidatus Adlerbacteria bacterium]